MEKHLHIICLDVPYPVDYGGVFDLFYKIKTLCSLGIKIHLHCFEYGRGEQLELLNYCEDVHYYSRKKGHKGLSHKLPYIVCSRSNEYLLENLLKDEYPILLEGIHCSYLLNDDRFNGRRVFLRLHNIEYKYYRGLYHSERNLLKKFYYLHESCLLKRYERKIANKAVIISVSRQDAEFYRQKFGAKHVHNLPVFVPFTHVESKTAAGCYCLYQGNLSVAENEAAAIWLLKHVFNTLEVPFVIAGKNPSPYLQQLAHEHKYTCLVANPSEEEMQDIIAKAQINILPAYNSTGVKLKLLNALYNGRHCLVNEEAVAHSGLEALCHVASNSGSFKQHIRRLYMLPLEDAEVRSRESVLSRYFDDDKNGKQLISWIW